MKRFLRSISLFCALVLTACIIPVVPAAAEEVGYYLTSSLSSIPLTVNDGKESYVKSQVRTTTIHLDQDAAALAEDGSLNLSISVVLHCGICRKQTATLTVQYYDENNVHLSGDLSDSESDYDTDKQDTTLTVSGKVPSKAKTIKVTVVNRTNLKSYLSTKGNVTFSSPTIIGETGLVGNTYSATIDTVPFSQNYDYIPSDRYVADAEFVGTIYLTGNVLALAKQGLLVYQAQVYSHSGICRTMHNKITVECYDANGNVLDFNAGRWVIDEKHYSSSKQDRTFNSNNVVVPTKTTMIKMRAAVNYGTATNCRLTGFLSLGSIEQDAKWYNNIISYDPDDVSPDDYAVQVKEFYPEGSTEGVGKTLYFTDSFANMPERVSSDDMSAVFRNAITNQNMQYYWTQFAYDVFKSEMQYDDHAGNGFDADFGGGHYSDLVYCLMNATDGYTEYNTADASSWTSSSGLKQATSWDSVFTDAYGDLAEHRAKTSSRGKSNLTADKFKNVHDYNIDEDYNGLIYYTYVNTSDQHGGTQKYSYNNFLLAFYDPVISAINDDTTYEMTSEDSGVPTLKTVLNWNDNSTNSSAEMSHSWVKESGVSNTLTQANGVTITNVFGAEVGYQHKWTNSSESSVNLNYSFSTEEAFQLENSKSTSESVSESSSDSISVELPPYTVGNLVSSTTHNEATCDYNMPLTIEFKVAFIGSSGNYYDDGAAVCDFASYKHHTMVKTLGYSDENGYVSATTDLRDSFYNESGRSDMNFLAISACAQPQSVYMTEDLHDGAWLIEYLSTHAPATYEAAKFSSDASYTENRIDVYPTRPLSYTEITNVSTVFLERNDIIYVTPGSSYDIWSNIVVDGFNAEGAQYYGFVQQNGYWALEDRDGNPIPESVAYLEESAATKKTYLTIADDYDPATAPKMMLLVYHINEDTYSHFGKGDVNYGDSGYVSDADLTMRASLQITVDVPMTYVAAAAPSSNTAAAFLQTGNELRETWKTVLATYGVTADAAQDAPVTNGQFVAMLYAMHQYQTTGAVSDDIGKNLDDFYAVANTWATENGLPSVEKDDPIYKQGMVLIAEKYLQRCGYTLTYDPDAIVPYDDDAEIPDWARDAVYTLKQSDFKIDNGSGSFLPGKTITYSDTVRYLQQLVTRANPSE